MTKEDFVRMTFDCPKELHKYLKFKAVEEGRTVKDIVLELIMKQQEKDKKK